MRCILSNHTHLITYVTGVAAKAGSVHLNEEAEYKKAAPRTEAIFKMYMANMAVR